MKNIDEFLHFTKYCSHLESRSVMDALKGHRGPEMEQFHREVDVVGDCKVKEGSTCFVYMMNPFVQVVLLLCKKTA